VAFGPPSVGLTWP